VRQKCLFGYPLPNITQTAFSSWLRILARVPNSILWLLKFPPVGEQHLLQTARLWAGEEIASRIIFGDVVAKGEHIMRARVADLFLDTFEVCRSAPSLGMITYY